MQGEERPWDNEGGYGRALLAEIDRILNAEKDDREIG
jgi:hypothetical protein